MRRLFVALGLLLPTPLFGQGVIVAPHAIQIDHRIRSGSVMLYNPGQAPVEVEIATLFGYPTTDSLGAIRLHVDSVPGPQEPSAANWIQAFPKRTTVEPGARQTVRLLARPPADLADGEYWTRLVVAARQAAAPPASTESTPIQIGFDLEIRTILALTYRKGMIETGLSLSELSAAPSADSLSYRLKFKRTGNGAFVGLAQASLVDSDGVVQRADTAQLAVYHEMHPRWTMPLDGLTPGDYWLRVETSNARLDIPPAARLPFAPVSDSIVVRIP